MRSRGDVVQTLLREMRASPATRREERVARRRERAENPTAAGRAAVTETERRRFGGTSLRPY